MSTINVNCIDQELVLENTPTISSGGVHEDYVAFTFCSQWSGFVRTAVFWRDMRTAYHVLLTNDVAEIPAEVLDDEGTIRFGVYGVNSAGATRTSEVLTYNIVQGAITPDTKPDDPAPDVYLQLLAQYAAILSSHLAAENVSIPSATADALGITETDPNVDDALKKLAAEIQALQPQEGPDGNVKYSEAQELTEEQKAQARENIGAASTSSAIDGGAVMYDTVQELAETQKARARSNIGAVSEADVTMAINTALGDYATALKALDAVVGMPETTEGGSGTT